MALAGPLANLLIAVLAGLAIRAGMLGGVFDIPDEAFFTEVTVSTADGIWRGAAVFLSIVFTLNIVLFAFNLIPLFPLDGASRCRC
jgi:Zn-dependent protease